MNNLVRIMFAAGMALCVGSAVAAQGYSSNSTGKYDPELEKSWFSDLRVLESEQQNRLDVADNLLKKWDTFARKAPTQATSVLEADKRLRAGSDLLQAELDRYRLLIYPEYKPLASLAHPSFRDRGSYLFFGKIVPGSCGTGRLCIQDEDGNILEVEAYGYEPTRLGVGFVALGQKTSSGTLRTDASSWGGMFAEVQREDFDDAVTRFRNEKDQAAKLYLQIILSKYRFRERFETLFQENMNPFEEMLEGAMGGSALGKSRANVIVTPEVEYCGNCGRQLVGGRCSRFLCSVTPLQKVLAGVVAVLLVGAIVVAVVLLGSKKPKCPQCGYPLVDGDCSNPDCPSKKRFCPVCRSEMINGQCSNAACPTRNRKCPDCGAPMQGDSCTNPSCPGKAGAGKPRCKSCGAILDEHGECPECTRVPDRPANWMNFDAEATMIPSKFSLKVLAPSKWTGARLSGLPVRFEMGRKPMDSTMPFLQLVMDGRDATSCSRRYLRFTQAKDEEGFVVDLLSDNALKIDGVEINGKGESLRAKIGSIIEIRPDWKFEVVQNVSASAD